MAFEVSPTTDNKERIRNSARVHGVGTCIRRLQTLRNEQIKLLKQRQGVDQRMVEIQRDVNQLVSVCQEDGIPLPSELLLPFNEDMPLSLSLADAVRNLLKQRGDEMTAGEIREGLIAMELDLPKLWNPVAVIRRTLKRLMERGEITGLPKDKPVRYRWVDPVGRALKLDPQPKARRREDPETRSVSGERLLAD